MDLTSPPLQHSVKGVIHGAEDLHRHQVISNREGLWTAALPIRLKTEHRQQHSDIENCKVLPPPIREDPNTTPPQSPQSQHSNVHDRAIAGAAVVWQPTPPTSPPSPVLGSNHDVRPPVQETLPPSISPTACLQCVLTNLPCSATHPTCTRCARRLRLAASPSYPSPPAPTAFGSTPCLAQRILIPSGGKGRGGVLCSCPSCKRDIRDEEDDWMAVRENFAEAVRGAGRHDDSAAWLWAPKGAGKRWTNWKEDSRGWLIG